MNSLGYMMGRYAAVIKSAANNNFMAAPTIPAPAAKTMPELSLHKAQIKPPKTPNPAAQLANTNKATAASLTPTIAPQRFEPAINKLAGEFPISMLFSDVAEEIAGRVLAKKKAKQDNLDQRAFTTPKIAGVDQESAQGIPARGPKNKSKQTRLEEGVLAGLLGPPTANLIPSVAYTGVSSLSPTLTDAKVRSLVHKSKLKVPVHLNTMHPKPGYTLGRRILNNDAVHVVFPGNRPTEAAMLHELGHAKNWESLGTHIKPSHLSKLLAARVLAPQISTPITSGWAVAQEDPTYTPGLVNLGIHAPQLIDEAMASGRAFGNLYKRHGIGGLSKGLSLIPAFGTYATVAGFPLAATAIRKHLRNKEKKASAGVDQESVDGTPDNDDRPFAPSQPNGQGFNTLTITGPGHHDMQPSDDPVNAGFQAVDRFNDTWQSNESTLESSDTMQQGGPYNDNSEVKTAVVAQLVLNAAKQYKAKKKVKNASPRYSQGKLAEFSKGAALHSSLSHGAALGSYIGAATLPLGITALRKYLLSRGIKSAGVSVNPEQSIEGDNHTTPATEVLPAYLDDVEIRGPVGDSPREGIPRIHDQLAGGRMDADDTIDKQFDSFRVPADTSSEENISGSGDSIQTSS